MSWAFWVPTPLNIIDLLDLMSTTGYLANIERGPGRHGISNAFFLYIRDQDGHRTEIYCSDYQTGVSVIPIERLTEADRKWLLTAEYGGTGGRPMESGMVVEEPDIEIGAGVSSKGKPPLNFH